MNKQEQIEEMAKDLENTILGLGIHLCRKSAEKLYDLGYRKVSADTLILIDELLIEFDEMGFAPTTLCENPDDYACEWKRQLVDEIERLKEKEALTHFENISNDTIISNLKNELKQQTVKDFAKRLKKQVGRKYVGNSMPEIIDKLLKEYEK